MTLDFKDVVFKGGFKPTEAAFAVEEVLRTKFGFDSRYEAARLMLGRSLAEPSPGPPPPAADTAYAKAKLLSGELLFGDEIDLWISLFVLDGNLGIGASVADFRAGVEAHWARGAALLREDLDQCSDDPAKLALLLAGFLPDGGEVGGGKAFTGAAGEIRLKVGSVSRTLAGDRPVDFLINGPAVSPHIALMGRSRSGKTTTGVQMALDLVEKAGIPVLFIDPKGEFVADGKLQGKLSKLGGGVGCIEMGNAPVPLDFLPTPEVGNVSITNAAMRLRDSIALCCKSPGNIQQDLLRTAIERVIRDNEPHDLRSIRDAYLGELAQVGREHDSIVSRLNELTSMECFTPEQSPTKFFSQSWVISLRALESEELKRLATLLLLDSVSSWVLSQPEGRVIGGCRVLRHLLVIDEARPILLEKKYDSLSQLIRRGASKGSAVMLLSQDPSDFDGQADDFTTQLGTVISFACNQTARGLKALSGAYGRKLQVNDFTDVTLSRGVAFAKLPGREPDRIRCWQPETT